jgi:hypothetical protein
VIYNYGFCYSGGPDRSRHRYIYTSSSGRHSQQ